MFRSLLGLIILASLNSGADFGVSETIENFDEVNLIEVNPIPVLKHESLAPDIKAKSALIMDYNTGLLLYEKNIHDRLPMASLTKIMVAIIILEEHDLDEVVTVESKIDQEVGVRIWLRQYEKMTVENLLQALLIPSAGDAAIALAEYHSGSVDAFVDVMNKRAKELNLIDTHFKNPIGLDDNDHYSSVYDLAILSKYALHMQTFRNIVRMKKTTIKSVDGRFEHDLRSTNYLLNSYLNILGVKTGTTDAAGQSLINLARNDSGYEIIAVLLNSPNRFQENKSMIDWAFRSYVW